MPIRLAAASACLAISAAQAGPAYAPVKERVCSDCTMPRTGFALPRHAVVAASWGFASQGSYFEVLDLDSGKLVHAFVPMPAVPGRPTQKASRRDVQVPVSALPPLTALANRLWADPHAIHSDGATDCGWNLWLIDGQDVRHEAGPGTPTALAAEWLRRVGKYRGARTPTASR